MRLKFETPSITGTATSAGLNTIKNEILKVKL